jgi:hypothetical protein
MKKNNTVIAERVLVSDKEDLITIIGAPVVFLLIILLAIYYAIMLDELNYFVITPVFLIIIIGFFFIFRYSLKKYNQKRLNNKLEVPTIVQVDNCLVLYNINKTTTTLEVNTIKNFVVAVPFELFRNNKIIRKYTYGSIVFYIESPDNTNSKVSVDFVANFFDVILKIRGLIT